MTNPKGGAFERDLLRYFRSEGIDAERLRLAGTRDEGDLVLKIGGLPFVLEAKNRKGLDLAGWVEEARLEAQHYGTARGFHLLRRPVDDHPAHFAVVHKRRMKPVSESFVTLPLHEYLRQLRPPF